MRTGDRLSGIKDGLRYEWDVWSSLMRVRRRFVRASIAQFLSRNGSDLLVDWETLRTTPVVGPIAMWFITI